MVVKLHAFSKNYLRIIITPYSVPVTFDDKFFFPNLVSLEGNRG